MPNPIPTHTAWKAEKVKYGIPDKVIKAGRFGEKVNALSKQFDKAGLGTPAASRAATAAEVFAQAKRLYTEWIDGAQKLKDDAFKNGKPSKDGKVNRSKAIDQVKQYRDFIVMFEQRYASLKDPFLSARSGGRDKCMNFYNVAVQHPDDTIALEHLYGQGVRNDLGMTFRKAVKDGEYKDNPTIFKMLQTYDKNVAIYHETVSNKKNGGAPAIAASPAKRTKFLADMKALIDLGDQILAATAPKN